MNKYTLIEELGQGGNGTVWLAKCNENCQEVAYKRLDQRKNKEKVHRFITEIKTVSRFSDTIKGIIPILDFSEQEFWYTMPIAVEAMNHIETNQLDALDIAKLVLQLAETLEKFHAENISHRDIKPSNIYYYNERFCFSDFGLVYIPDDEDRFTRSDKGLGAIFTIAPEMKRDPKNADGKKADVFSLAKTMWMFLSGDERGFDGTYNYADKTHSLRLMDKYKSVHLVELENLIYKSTQNDPNARPTITEFIEALYEWIEIYSDRLKSQSSEWDFIKVNLFGKYPAESCTWTDLDRIVEILNIVGSSPAYKHMLFSGRGGLDFCYACKANESGLLEINADGCCHLVKPKALHFSGFDDCRWNYFFLELEEITPILSENYFEYEVLVEDTPAHYVSAQYAQYGVYDYETGVAFPEGYRVVRRYTKGKFLIVLKSGPYNAINSTYDGRHGKYDNPSLRRYIEDLAQKFQTIKTHALEKYKDISEWELEHRILKLPIFNDNPQDKSISKATKPEKRSTTAASEEQFLRNNHKSISFLDLLNQSEPNLANIKFYFEYQLEFDICSWLLNNKKTCICVDGLLKEVDINDTQCFYVYSREEALNVKKNCVKRIEDFVRKNGILLSGLYGEYISINLSKINNPTYLFTKDDIRELMKNADDRVDNQLVIDEFGVPQLVRRDNEGLLYPVRAETWDAGNNYVGKYSKLEALNDTYVGMLNAWLLYLKTGKRQKVDYFDIISDENTLINEIQSIMKA